MKVKFQRPLADFDRLQEIAARSGRQNSAIAQLTDMIHATLVGGIEPWPLPPLETTQELISRIRGWPDVPELLEAFLSQCGIGDALYTLLEHNLITPGEVDRLSCREGRGGYITFKPLVRRAYLDAVAQGLVPGRLN
jgi:hypothetical protein